MAFFKTISLTLLFVFSLTLIAADGVLPPSLTGTGENLNASETNYEIAPTLPNEADDSRNIPQPEVRIIRKQDTVIEEYRVNGRLRYVKITPAVGKPYYMIDTNGDGILDTRENDLDNPPINQWILLEW